MYGYLSCAPMLACNPGMSPDWESNQQPLGSQAVTQSSEPYQSGRLVVNFIRTIADVSHKTYSRIILKTWKPTFCEMKLINDLGLSSFGEENYFYH